MTSKGADAMLELRSHLQEKRASLLRQVEEERRRVASLEQESAQVQYDYDIIRLRRVGCFTKTCF